MADSPEPPFRRPSNTSASAPRLQYPTFPPLSASVEEWLSRSRPTSMTSASQSDNPSRMLSESWATLSASDAHSEDGTRSEQTDLGSLVDQTSADDVASLDDRYSSSEIDGNDEDHDNDEDEDADEDSDYGDGNQGYTGKSGIISESQELPALYHRFGGDVEDSGLTAKTAFRQSAESIEFVEPEKWPEIEQVELKHTIQVFSGAEAARLKEQLPYNLQDSVLSATVQQTMTKQGLAIDQPFRVLYIGNSDYRNIILDKIGDVLVSNSSSSFESSSTESSRYHVIPTSFGAGAVPNFAELLPIHVQLVVDECLEASTDPQSGKPSTMSLKFKNRPSCTSFWTGSEYRVSSSSDWTLPDVALFFVSTSDDAAAWETQHLARTFMERHGVPAMVISEKPLWAMTTNLMPINRHGLHMCLETRHALTGETAVLRRYPIDLQTFESITPSQLNRNLASLASIYPKQSHRVTAEAPKSPAIKSFRDNIEKCSKHAKQFVYSNRAQEWIPALRLLALTVVFGITISLGYSAVNAAFLYLSQFFGRSTTPQLASPDSSSIHTTNVIPVESQRQTSLSIKHSPASEVILKKLAEDRSQLEELMGVSLSSSAQQGNPSKFELQVVGDCHVVVKPPQRFSTAGKKQPNFGVRVTRHESTLSYELSKLFEGVYSLKLDREDAHGLVNVTITTHSKPPLKETTQVDFGTPWLKIANWKRAASAISSQLVQDLSTAQTGLSRAYDRLRTDLQVAMGDVVRRSHVLRQEVDVFHHESVQLSLDTRNAVLARSKQLSEVVRRSAVQPFWAACSAFQEHSGKVNTEAKELISNTWDRIKVLSASSINLEGLIGQFRKARKCETLGKAQKRVQRLTKRKTCRHNAKRSTQGCRR